MAYPYLPHTNADIAQMLEACGFESTEQMLDVIPKELRLQGGYSLPQQMSEPEVRRFFDSLTAKCEQLVCFAGNGYYARWCPAAVASIIARSEFLTAYTPYQPEISQGTLHYIFEYQTIMSRLTGLPISNASLYDGATATAEAALMAVASTRKKDHVVISGTVNQVVIDTVVTYCKYHGIKVTATPITDDGKTDIVAIEELINGGDVAGVIVAQRNRYGIIEDYEGLADKIHQAKGLLIMNCIASDLAILKTPAEWGIDIAVGDAQSLGMPLNFGGPYLGFMTSTEALMRKMPGRIVGATTDANGVRSFVLTLQAREQHIRREKATSNICSNQGIMALYVAAYTALVGSEGLREINRVGASSVRLLAEGLCQTGKFTLTYPDSPFLNEVLLSTDIELDQLLRFLSDHGILGGVKIAPNRLLVAATELQSVDDINRYTMLVGDFIAKTR